MQFATAQRESRFFSLLVVRLITMDYSALVNVTDADGKSIFAGKSATGFSNAEEIMLDGVKVRVSDSIGFIQI